MRPVHLIGLVLAALVAGPQRSVAQAADCKQYVLQSYEIIQQKYAPTGVKARETVRFAMRVDTYHRRPGQTTPVKSTQQVESLMRGNLLYYTDGATEVFQAPGELVAVAKEQKMVFISNASYQPQQQVITDIGLLRTGIVQESEVTGCRREKRQGKWNRLVQLTPKKAFRDQFQARYLELVIDERTHDLTQYTIVYNQAAPVDHVQYTLLTTAATSSPKLPASPFSYVLEHNKTLRPQFAGYQLVDQRKH